MAISGILDIYIGLQNESAGSDSLFTAFTKTQTNFTTLFNNASPYNTFIGVGINANAVSSSGTLTLTNTGVIAVGDKFISDIELTYLDGVNSNIQTQINDINTDNSNLETTVNLHTTQITALQTSDTAQNTAITNLQTTNTTQTNQIMTIACVIVKLQP